MSNGIWNNEEVKNLFDTVEKVKNKNMPLKQAFVLHGESYSRKPNSVRNYYYHEIDNLKSDKNRLEKLGINLSKHEKNEINFFSSDEEKKLMTKIDSDVKNGLSVRKSCLNLSNGNIELMLRYQNKYRNFLAKRKQQLKKDNIVKFVNKKASLTDSELQSLFMGIVRLVKKTTTQEVLSENQSACDKANAQLRKTLVSLNEKQSEIEKLKSDFLRLKEENVKLMNDIVKLRSDKASKLREKFSNKRQVKLLNI